MEEERRFTVLLERVEQQYQLLSEKVGGLDRKIDDGLQDVRCEMKAGFEDMRTGISVIVKDIKALKHHRHARSSDV
jgi:hypothetical protein